LKRWHEEVQSVAQLIVDAPTDDKDVRACVLDLIPLMAVEQPLKTPFVAAVVLVVNSQKPELLGDLLARLSTLTQERIQAGEWREVKLYLKLLACLQGCLEGDGLFPVLEELFNRAVDLQTASSDDVG